MIGTTTARPPRPHVPPAELLDKYRAHGSGEDGIRQVKAAWTTWDGDTVIELDSGTRLRIVEPGNPDGAGRTGLLTEYHPKGYRVGVLAAFTPRAVGNSDFWTLGDLQWAAGKLVAPTIATMVADGWGGYGSWLNGGDDDLPIRAFALWASEARRQRAHNSLTETGITLAQAAHRSPMCAALRRQILASGWLSDSAARELDTL